MAKRKRYYVGRIHFGGRLTPSGVVEALTSPQPVDAHGLTWTVIDTKVKENDDGSLRFVYGRLVKYREEGSVPVVDLTSRSQIARPEPNLIDASSPFVYIPAHSGLGFQHIWNKIEFRTFPKRLAKIITFYHGDFFVECSIELISDLRRFIEKLSAIQRIERVRARVEPPNPLFGPLWASLKEHLLSRNAGQLKVDEKAVPGGALLSKVAEHVREQVRHPDNLTGPEPTPDEPANIVDAALLMAADGYGSGVVSGTTAEKPVTVRTGDTVLNFEFDADPSPETLYEIVKWHLQQIETERGLQHEP